MEFIKTPLIYKNDSLVIARDIKEQIAMIDNFIEFIVFSPKGSFVADDDFGFDYWNYEYSNVHLQSFNLRQDMHFNNGLYNEITLKECKESIEKSLEVYEPQLKQVNVSIELGAVKTEKETSHKLLSKYEVTISISGMLDDGLGTLFPYKKEVSFLMEPTIKRINI